MSLNSAYANEALMETDSQLISASGPFITLIQAVMVFLVMRKYTITLLYPFLFTCFYSRMMAAIISLGNLNDEARISKFLGVGTFTLPLIVTTLLFLLVFRVSRLYDFTTRFNLITLGLIMFFSSIIILSDQFLDLRLL